MVLCPYAHENYPGGVVMRDREFYFECPVCYADTPPASSHEEAIKLALRRVRIRRKDVVICPYEHNGYPSGVKMINFGTHYICPVCTCSSPGNIDYQMARKLAMNLFDEASSDSIPLYTENG